MRREDGEINEEVDDKMRRWRREVVVCAKSEGGPGW